MWSYGFVLREVSNVIEGSSVDGATRLPKRVSFPKRREIVDAAVSLTQILYMVVGAAQRRLADDHAARTAIVFKLLAYLTRTGRVAPESMRDSAQDIAGIALILSERPELIAASVNFANVLALHAQAQLQRKRTTNESVQPASSPPPQRPAAPPHRVPRRRRRVLMERCEEPLGPATSRPVLWSSSDGGYCLQELIHPQHLVDESRALGHCVGRQRAGPETEDGNLQNLRYWRLIKRHQSRIFSFGSTGRTDAGPLCTLHVQLPSHVLVEAGPQVPRVLTGTEPYFPALMASLEALDSVFGSLCIGSGQSVAALSHWREAEFDDELRRARRRRRRRLDS
jgi:hypothetical protein